ncbi:MAG: hypothetical protein WA929_15190 [Pseudomonas neustonica]
MIRTVEDSAEALAVAQRNLVAATIAAYPKDMIVIAELNGYQVELIVLSADVPYWSRAGQIIGRNTKTGKQRSFYDSNVIRIKHNPTTHCTARTAGQVLATQMDMRSVTNA